MENLGVLLKRLRATAGLSQEELAERAGVSARSISDTERGLRSTIYRDTARRLADALGMEGTTRDQFEAAARGRVVEPALSASSIPPQPTRLIGRDKEVAAIVDALRDPRLRAVTITGPGGIGKTRAGIEAASLAQVDFDDGAFFAALGSLRDPNVVPSAIAQAVGAPSAGDTLEAIGRRLHGRQCLLMLDTFEHLMDSAPFVADVLALAEWTTVLITSREPLRLRGEHEFMLPTLDIDDGSRLFVERARAVRPDLELDRDAIGSIVRRVDGLPLAIELAAARIRHLPLGTLRDQLDLSVLTEGGRDVPERQRTMRDTITWSYELLAPEQREMFARLSVFDGGWTLEAASAVTGCDLGILSALVDKNLVSVTGDRYGMLDVIREFAAGLGDDQAVRRAHAEFLLALAEDTEPALGSDEQETAYARLHAERDNIGSAVRWAIDDGQATIALRLAGAVWHYWRAQGQISEGRAWLREALEVGSDDRDAVAKATWGAAWLALHQADLDEAESLSVRLLAIARQTGDPLQTRNGLTVRAMVAMARGHFSEAMPSLVESVEICRSLGRNWYLATSYLILGQAQIYSGDTGVAHVSIRQALEIYREIGDHQFEARAQAYDGWASGLEGDSTRARELLSESLQRFVDLGNVTGTAECLEGLAAFEPDALRAARLAGRADALRERNGSRPLPFDHVALQRLLTDKRGAVSEHEWRAAADEGRAQSREELLPRD